MKKLFYSVCIAGILASCSNEAKNNEAKAADEVKITAAYDEMNTAEMQKVNEECMAAVTAAAHARLDSINALPKAAQVEMKKAHVAKHAAKKTTPAPIDDHKVKVDAKGNQVGTPTGSRD